MTKSLPLKALSVAAVIVLATAFGTSAFAHNVTNSHGTTNTTNNKPTLSKSEAKKLVKRYLVHEYGGEGLRIQDITKDDGQWNITIKRHLKTVAIAKVDLETGNIHIQ